LRSQSDEPARLAPLRQVVVAEDADRTAVQPRQPDDRIDRRRLARAIGPKEAEKIARFNLQRNAVNGGEVAVTLDDMRDFER
jgi:hypothetical protein